MNTYDWPKPDPTPADLLQIYQNGFPACHVSAATDEALFGDGLLYTFSTVCPHLAGLHKAPNRTIVPLFLSRVKFDPTAFAEEAQTTGDCVSHGSRNCRDTTRCVEIDIKGEAEIYDIRGATEPTYGARQHRGAGMDPALASRFEVENGFMFRRDYPELGVNLSVYNSSIGSGWGGSGVPEKVKAECKKHKVGRWIRPENPDQALDLLAAGYAAHSGQNVGFSSRPNNQGYHSLSGRWNHDMATVGYDISKTVWPVDVVFIVNSWGDFNTQPPMWPWQKVAGMITARLEDWARYFVGGSMYFYADIEGVPAKQLPDWGTSAYL